MEYKIAIPTYKRYNMIQMKTLNYLFGCGIDAEDIYIFVANKKEYGKYKKAFPYSLHKNLIIAKPTLRRARVFMRNYFNEGEHIVFMDDDIDRLCTLGSKEKKLIDLEDFDGFIKKAFRHAIKNHCRLWGICSHNNAFYMNKSVSMGLRYVIGTFYGLINTHDKDTYISLDDPYQAKEGCERSILFYLKDGAVMRVNHVGLETKFFNNRGGLTGMRTKESIRKAGESLIKKYPQYIYFKKKSNRDDLALRNLKPMFKANHKWW